MDGRLGAREFRKSSRGSHNPTGILFGSWVESVGGKSAYAQQPAPVARVVGTALCFLAVRNVGISWQAAGHTSVVAEGPSGLRNHSNKIWESSHEGITCVGPDGPRADGFRHEQRSGSGRRDR